MISLHLIHAAIRLSLHLSCRFKKKKLLQKLTESQMKKKKLEWDQSFSPSLDHQATLFL